LSHSLRVEFIHYEGLFFKIIRGGLKKNSSEIGRERERKVMR